MTVRVKLNLKTINAIMTGPGATYPYGVDPEDSNLRIAPSLPLPRELKAATEVFCLCVRLAALEKLLHRD